MPASVNKVILIGNLGGDPELKYTTSNKPVCNLSIATNERGPKGKDGKYTDRVEWHRITVWNETAENCAKYLAKGRSVYIEGRIQTREWTDKEGNKRFNKDIIADRVVFLGGDQKHPANDVDTGERAPDPKPAERAPGADDDIPF